MSATILNRKVGPIGFGLMGLTSRPESLPYDEAVKVMKKALELGANFWNGGELYGPPHANSLHLLEYYFRKYPEDSEKVVLSIKGCFDFVNGPDNSAENVRKSVDNCLEILQGRVPISIFEPARVDPKTPIEETVKVLAEEYVKTGKIGGIGLSECSASTIRRAQAIHPICAVEVELSLFSREIFENGIYAACTDLDIPIVAYGPLGSGLLSGQFKAISDLDEKDFRKHHSPRFQPGVFESNLRIVDAVRKISDEKEVTLAQTAIAWVRAQGRENTVKEAPQVIPIPGCITESRVEENLKDVKLDQKELAELDELVKQNTVQGGRYGGALAALMNGDSAPAV